MPEGGGAERRTPWASTGVLSSRFIMRKTILVDYFIGFIFGYLFVLIIPLLSRDQDYFILMTRYQYFLVNQLASKLEGGIWLNIDPFVTIVYGL